MKTLGRLLALLVALGILFLLLFPVFAKPRPGQPFVLHGPGGHPMQGVLVSVNCDGRKLNGQTDHRGGFGRPCRNRAKATVDGYDKTYVSHHTGGNPGRRYHFSRRGSYRFRFLDENGKQLEEVPVQVAIQVLHDIKLFGPASSEVLAKDVPVGVPSGRISLAPVSRHWRLVSWHRTGSDRKVEIEAVLRWLPEPLERIYWMSDAGGRIRFH